jgi:hypothetical protein
VLSALADLGYPPGDPALIPLRERVLAAWLDESFYAEFEVRTKAGPIGSAVCRSWMAGTADAPHSRATRCAT